MLFPFYIAWSKHFGSWENTRVAALRCASWFPYATLVFSQLPACLDQESVCTPNPTHTVPAYFIAVFIYSMPGYQCPIKERMLYSSCKGPLLQIAEEVIGMEIPKKVGPPSVSLRLQNPFSRL